MERGDNDMKLKVFILFTGILYHVGPTILGFFEFALFCFNLKENRRCDETGMKQR